MIEEAAVISGPAGDLDPESDRLAEDTMMSKAIELVRDCYGQSARARRTLDEKRLDWYKAYRSIADPLVNIDTQGEIETLSNLWMPWTFGMIEQRVPRILGRLPQVIVSGSDEEYDPQWSETIQSMIRRDMKKSGYFMSSVIHIKQADIYGWSVRRNFWRYKWQTRIFSEPINDPSTGMRVGTNKVPKRVTQWDQPWTQVLDIWRCFPQPGALSIEDSDWFIEESIHSRKSIWQMAQQGLFDGGRVLDLFEGSSGLNYSSQGSQSELTDNPYWARVRAMGYEGQEAWYSGQDHFPRHRLLTFWTDQYVITLADERWLLRIGEPGRPGIDNNEYGRKPFREFKSIPIPFMMEGESAVRVFYDVNEAINCQVNQRIDNINLALNKVILGPKTGMDWENMVMAPGQHVECDDPTRYKFLEVPPVGQETFAQSRELLEVGQFALGINDYLAPSTSSTRLNRTARGIQSIQEQSGMVFSLVSELYDIQDVGPTAEDYYTLRQTFMDRASMVRIRGDAGYVYMRVAPEDLNNNPDIEPIGGSAQPQDALQKKNDANLLFQTLYGNPIAMQLGLDMKKIQDMYLEVNGQRDPSKMYLKPPEHPLMVIQKEHQSMSFGNPVPATGDDRVHLMLHHLFLNSPYFEMIQEKYRVVFMDHVNAHMAKFQGSPQSEWFERERAEEMVRAHMIGGDLAG